MDSDEFCEDTTNAKFKLRPSCFEFFVLKMRKVFHLALYDDMSGSEIQETNYNI